LGANIGYASKNNYFNDKKHTLLSSRLVPGVTPIFFSEKNSEQHKK